MSLLSLLIALAADRTLSAEMWRFNFYYQHYLHFFSKNFTAKQGTMVRGITLTDNPEHIEGKVNGTRIVLVSAYLKKA